MESAKAERVQLKAINDTFGRWQAELKRVSRYIQMPMYAPHHPFGKQVAAEAKQAFGDANRVAANNTTSGPAGPVNLCGASSSTSSMGQDLSRRDGL